MGFVWIFFFEYFDEIYYRERCLICYVNIYNYKWGFKDFCFCFFVWFGRCIVLYVVFGSMFLYFLCIGFDSFVNGIVILWYYGSCEENGYYVKCYDVRYVGKVLYVSVVRKEIMVSDFVLVVELWCGGDCGIYLCKEDYEVSSFFSGEIF